MADKKQDFVVSDRRRFGAEGELRPDAPREEEKAEPAAPVSTATAPLPEEKEEAKTPAAAPTPPAAPAPPTPAATDGAGEAEEEMPEPPSAAEMQEQRDAYHASGKKIEDLIGKSGGRATLPEMSFERLVESFYMTALLQLGAIRQEGETPGVDIMGARQTIDSLTILQEKTKGNLSDREQTLLQNVLFELRMAWIEITNALASAKPGPGPGPGLGHEKK
ncbi:MAG TPA: DUF1844 domain-containing protein [Candidatus Angelobacter sp.]|nr:DUF1844 domain-containing protein [Candidatus Angelobacter sp.]